MPEPEEGLPGRPTGIPCPMGNCSGQVVYNSNYFCSLWTHPYTGQPRTCNWALSSDDFGQPIGKRDREVWAKIQETFLGKRNDAL